MSRARVGILLFDDVEVLDFAGPFEVFSVARPPGENDDRQALFEVVTIAQEARTVRCRGGLLVQPHHTVSDHPPLEILVVPGGQGTRREMKNAALVDWIAAQRRIAPLTTSVCTGALLLAERGLLDGLRATTHWTMIGWMREHYPSVRIVEERVVDEGDIITSAGVSAGIDMALHVVARLHDTATAAWTARRMEYDTRSPS
jgi:transcriptional regulator GlxA family with amidase domain